MDWRAVGCVAAGGACGSVLRFLGQRALLEIVPGFPWGTSLINLVGSFTIGVVTPLLPRLPADFKPLVVTGVLGGFTTMSGFALETLQLNGDKRIAAALGYWASGAVLCVAACAVGLWVAGLAAAE